MAKRKKRLSDISSHLQKLYEDKCGGLIPDSVFQGLMSNFVTEQQELEAQLAQTKAKHHEQSCTDHEIGKWLQMIEGYMEIKELDRATVMALIESITIHESTKVTGKRTQEVGIVYRFIGNLLDNAKEGTA